MISQTSPLKGSLSQELLEVGVGRILVVDDQPGNIQVVGTILGALGHEIIPANDGPTALKRLALSPPDLILLDLLMPGMDGCEFCRRLQESPTARDIPVIFLSAADDKDLIVRALEAGGVDYITKPFNRAELISRVRTQLVLKLSRDRLRRLAEDKDELIGILAHDMKNHLGGMQMSAQLLRDRVTRQNDPRLLQLSENILNSSERLLAFVKEFLANAAVDHGLTLTLGPVHIASVIDTAVQRWQEIARRKNIVFKVKVSSPEGSAVADASAVDQIVDNLLSNAIKFSQPNRKIEITLEANETQIACSIRDEGPGFTEEDKTRMFRRYGRLSARPTGGEPSTGLGLSIVQKLVRAMNGNMTCESVVYFAMISTKHSK